MNTCSREIKFCVNFAKAKYKPSRGKCLNEEAYMYFMEYFNTATSGTLQ